MNRRHQDFQSCALPTELPAHHEFSRIAETGRKCLRKRAKRAMRPSPCPLPGGEKEKLFLLAVVEVGAGVGLEDDAIVVVHREGLVEHERHVVLDQEAGQARDRHRVGVQVERQR